MKADKIFYSSNIYTVTNGCVAGGVAVSGNKIIAVGSVQEIEAYKAPETEILDLKDKFLMPGLVEGHTHMIAYREVADLSDAMSIDECKEIIREQIKAKPDMEMVIGEKWYAANWGGALPTKEDADEAVPDKPFWATDLDIHQMWLNSLMMEKIGLSKDTIMTFSKNRPAMVDVDKNGEPTGIIRDEVCMDVMLDNGVKADNDNITKMFDVWTRYGVTTVNDMDFFEIDSDILKITAELLKEGRLNVRVLASLDAAKASDEDIIKGKKEMSSDMLKLNALKTFLDGTGAGLTAYMLRPYKDSDTKGNAYRTDEELTSYIESAIKHGLATHMHTCGDAAIRQALNAYKKIAKTGALYDERFSIEHCDTTDPEDIPDIAALNISVNLTPDFLAPTNCWKDNPYIAVYNERERQELWTLKSFVNAKINVSFGSDGPASSMNPMNQLYRAIARCANDGLPVGGYRPQEAIDIETALYCYTMGGARSVGMEDKIGSIEAGKYADLIVWDINPLKASAMDIKNAKVLMTVSDGRVVYNILDK